MMSDREKLLAELEKSYDIFCPHETQKRFCLPMDLKEALIAALSEPEWQPISTAPRDGTPVLVYAPYGGGFITQSYWKAMPNNGHMWVVDCGEICPTHWMPLPKGPQQ